MGVGRRGAPAFVSLNLRFFPLKAGTLFPPASHSPASTSQEGADFFNSLAEVTLTCQEIHPF